MNSPTSPPASSPPRPPPPRPPLADAAAPVSRPAAAVGGPPGPAPGDDTITFTTSPSPPVKLSPSSAATTAAGAQPDKPAKGFAIFGRILYTAFILVPLHIALLPLWIVDSVCYRAGAGEAGAPNIESTAYAFRHFTTQIAGIRENLHGRSYNVKPGEDDMDTLKTMLGIVDPTPATAPLAAPTSAPTTPPPPAAAAPPPSGTLPPAGPPPPLPTAYMKLEDVKDKSKVETWLSNPMSNAGQTDSAHPYKLYYITYILAHWAKQDDKDGQDIVDLAKKSLAGSPPIDDMQREIIDELRNFGSELGLTQADIAKIEAKLK